MAYGVIRVESFQDSVEKPHIIFLIRIRLASCMLKSLKTFEPNRLKHVLPTHLPTINSPQQQLMSPQLKAIIDHYQFDKIPIEGTLYKSTYVSPNNVNESPAGTAIIGLYSHEPYSVSTFHRLKHDEVWHFYKGDPLVLHLLYPDGTYHKVTMGTDILNGQKIQFVVPANVWQAGELLPKGEFALYGCTMAPGFTGSCFEGGTKTELLQHYPMQKEIINRLSVEGHETKMPADYTQ